LNSFNRILRNRLNSNSNLNTNDTNDDAIQQQNIINPHNGCNIDEIKYSPNLKFLVTQTLL
jgi:hypothetical protein